MTKGIPEPWATAFTRAKMTDPRNGAPSMRAVAQAIDSNPSTISDMVHGRRNPSVRTIEQVAQVLNVSATTVAEWIGQSRSEVAPYSPPAEASYLTARQRKALDELIRAMAEQGARHDREAEPQQGPEASGQEHARTDRPEDGSTPRRGGPIVDLDQARRIKDDPATFGDQNRRGDMDQGRLQPPPPAERSAAYEPHDRSEGIRGADESRDRGEENQDDGR